MTKIATNSVARPILREWVKALRSGEYRQGQGQLKNETWPPREEGPHMEYCCLGVLADLDITQRMCNSGWDSLDPNAYVHWESQEPIAREDSLPGDLPELLNLSVELTDEQVEAVLGWKIDWEVRKYNTLEHLFIYLNDDEGVNFNGIADAIERLVELDEETT